MRSRTAAAQAVSTDPTEYSVGATTASESSPKARGRIEPSSGNGWSRARFRPGSCLPSSPRRAVQSSRELLATRIMERAFSGGPAVPRRSQASTRGTPARKPNERYGAIALAEPAPTGTSPASAIERPESCPPRRTGGGHRQKSTARLVADGPHIVAMFRAAVPGSHRSGRAGSGTPAATTATQPPPNSRQPDD